MTPQTVPSESVILADILLDLGARPGIRLFRNTGGLARDNRGHKMRFGLCVGASDLIGWKSVGGRAVFVALEVKSATGRATDEQVAFLDAVTVAGGIAAVVRSVAEARFALAVDA